MMRFIPMEPSHYNLSARTTDSKNTWLEYLASTMPISYSEAAASLDCREWSTTWDIRPGIDDFVLDRGFVSNKGTYQNFFEPKPRKPKDRCEEVEMDEDAWSALIDQQ